MALNINGTTGISGVDGSASAPALQGTDSNTGINFGSDTVNINTGGTTRATVDSSGNLTVNEGNLNVSKPAIPTVLVQNSTDTSFSTVKLQQSSGSGGSFSISKLGTNSSATGGANAAQLWQSAAAPIVFATNNTERMRITSAGQLGIGTTSSDKALVVNRSGGVIVSEIKADTANAICMDLNSSISTGRAFFFRFIYNGNGVGNVYSDGSTTVYNTGSDYRLKENVVAISDGITRLKALKPSRFNFKRDSSKTVDGFLAHEVSSIVPEAISGTKDEVATEDNEEQGVKKGDPIYQGIDQSKLVPLLTAALQEAIAKIEVLETKVAALEAG